jgi:hypothetical protein
LSICGRLTAQAGTPGIVILDIKTGSSAAVACPLERAATRAPLLVTIGPPNPAGSAADRTLRPRPGWLCPVGCLVVYVVLLHVVSRG